MKELSIEEKAKRYDEALEAIKSLQEVNPSDEGIQNWVNENFPELKESEDERIRKELLEHCKNQAKPYIQTGNKCPQIQSWIVWLEKQGEQKSKKVSLWKHWKDGIAGNGEGKPIYLIKDGYTYSISSCLGFECDYIELSELDKLLSEKQCEQKPYGQREECLDCQVNYAGECKGSCAMKRGEQILANSAKTCKDGQKPVEEYNITGIGSKNAQGKLGEMIKNLKPVNEVLEQKPTKWSEEDELHIRELESLVKQSWAVAEHKNDKDTIHKMSDLSFFLKTLKPQPKQEWSEEYEKRIKNIEESLLAYKIIVMDNDMELANYIEKEINWLKSLKPQNTWKPSDEQMNAVKDAIDYLGCNTKKVREYLMSLYEQLKKLRKE